MADWIDQNGGAVKSDDGGIHLTVPPGAWQGRRQLSIAEKTADTRVATAVRQPIRPARAFTLDARDETGNEVHAAFDQPVQLTIHVRSADLVRVVSPRCILYWLDPASNQWVEAPSVYDRRSGTVVAELAHFSDYLMGVGDNGAITPSVDGYQVDLNSGNAETSIPLKVPPGVHGFEPKLALTYSTGGPCGYISQFHATFEQSQASWVGLGWDLNPGYILRTNFATPEERFYLFLNNRSYDLIYNPNDGRYHTQVEEFLWVQYVPDTLGNGYEYAIACGRDGTQYRFGYELHDFTGTNFYHDPPGSRMDGFWSGNGDHWEPVRYCLDEIRDPSGNVISITYSAEEGTSGSTTYDRWLYPAEITYTSGDPTASQRKIVFNLASGRQDLPNTTMTHHWQTQFLDSIDEYIGSALVRKYVFQYDRSAIYSSYSNDTKTYELLLTGLVECDGTASPGLANGTPSGNTLPSLTFQYYGQSGQPACLAGWTASYTPPQYCPLPLLRQASNGNGGVVTYSYQVDQYNQNGGRSDMQPQYWSVQYKDVQDGRNNSYRTTYAHPQLPSGSGPFAGWAQKFEVQPFGPDPYANYPVWRGFNIVTVTEPTGVQVEYRFLRGLSGGYAGVNPDVGDFNVTRSDGQTFGDSEALKGRLYEVRYFEIGGSLSGSDWTTWTLDDPAGGVPYPINCTPSGMSGNYQDWNIYFARKVSFQRNRGTSYLYQAFTIEGKYGNHIETFEYDTAQSGSWVRHVKNYFFPNDGTSAFNPGANPPIAHYMVDRNGATSYFSYDGSSDGHLEQSTWYCYDGSYSYAGQVGTTGDGADGSWHGYLTATRRWRWYSSGPLFLDTTYRYDRYGNRVGETVWNVYGTPTALPSALSGNAGRATTTVYETTYNTFPQTVTVQPVGNPPLPGPSLVTSTTYDARFGTVLTRTDPNLNTTTYAYDGFGRVVAVWAPGDDASQLNAATVLVAYQAGGNQPFRVQIGRRKDAGGGLYARRAYEWHFYDGRGLLIQTQTDFDRTTVPIRAQDLNDLATAITGYGGTPSYDGVSFRTVGAGTSLIKASDFVSLRAGIAGLWTGANPSLGALPNWSSGISPGGPSLNGTGLSTTKTPISLSDLVDLRQWLNQYESATIRSLHAWNNPAGTVTVVDKVYDGRGSLLRESAPHVLSLNVPGLFASGDWNAYETASSSSTSTPFTTYTYDALKRPLTRLRPGASAAFTWGYTGFQTTLTDENGNQTVQTRDALGRLTRVQEACQSAATSYTYSVADQLLSVTDAAGHVTQIAYDSLGRKASLVDPDLGAWTDAYDDSSGHVWPLYTQTDARGQTLTYTYDGLNRLTNKSGPYVAATYGYDAGTNGKGKRTSMTDTVGTVTYAYDNRGRLSSLTRTVSGTPPYSLSFTYDDQDRVLSLSYPNGDVLTYVYGDHGKPIHAILNGTTYLVKGATYNALGKVTSLPLGNGLQTTWQYWGIDYTALGTVNYGLPYRIQTGTVQNQGMEIYDAVGNVTNMNFQDHTTETLSFTYTPLNALASATGFASSPTSESLSYAQPDIANIGNKDNAPYNYGAAPIHATSAVGGLGSYTYDNNGNRVADPSGLGFNCDADNHLLSLTSGPTTVFQNV